MQNQMSFSCAGATYLRVNLNDNKVRYKRADGWTREEFEKLKKAFSVGKRIKEMAAELGRTESAIHKFLSRSGIRKTTTLYKSSKSYCSAASKKKEDEINKFALITEKTDFEDVMSYLRSKGHSVLHNVSKNIFYEDAEYTLNNKPISKIKLLLFANRLRTEEKKAVFAMTDIIW